MQPYEYQTMHTVEDTYWWYTGLRTRVIDSLKKIVGNADSAHVLDGGCGTGGMMHLLQKAFPKINIIGIDLSTQAIQFAMKRRVGTVITASVDTLPFKDETFDVIISLDVLQAKRADNLKALSEFHRVLKEEGSLMLNLPAFKCLKGQHDLAVHVGQRYTKKTLCPLLTQSGFTIMRVTYWNAFFFPLLMVWRPLSRIFADISLPVSDLRPLPPFANRLLTWFIREEIKLSNHISLPFGSSVFAVSQKEGKD